MYVINLFETHNSTSKLICKALVLIAGFDNNNVKWLLRIDMPASLTRAFQEIGRVGLNLNTLPSENIVDVIAEVVGSMVLLNRSLLQHNESESSEEIFFVFERQCKSALSTLSAL